MQMHMLVVISKLAWKKQFVHVALHLILQHDKPNLHITYNNNHIATTHNINNIIRELDRQQHQE
jgi:nucleoid-associated protein YejK